MISYISSIFLYGHYKYSKISQVEFLGFFKYLLPIMQVEL